MQEIPGGFWIRLREVLVWAIKPKEQEQDETDVIKCLERGRVMEGFVGENPRGY